MLQTQLGDDVALSMTSPFLPGVTRRQAQAKEYLSCSITLELRISGQTIIPVNVGDHDSVYS